MLAKVRSYLASFAVTGVTAILIIAAVGAVAVWHFGSVSRVLAYLHGEGVVAEPTAVDVGEVAPRVELTRVISLTNLTSRSVRILGGNTTCDFALAESLPMDIGPGESCTINLRIRPGLQTGDLQYTYLFVADGVQRPIRVSVTGKVVVGQSEEPPLAGT